MVPEIHTTEMHTAGEPLRIVTSGYPEIRGDTILDKRRYAREHLDHLRRLLMFEPRGHFDMYGAVPVAPDHPEADLAVLFLHNEGYSTMCGHGVIALGRWAVDTGLVTPTPPETSLAIQVPAGLVRCRVETTAAGTGGVRFDSVPAFAAHLDAAVEVPGHGRVAVDIGYGGAFYAILPAARVGLDVRRSAPSELVAAAAAVTGAAASELPIDHPDDPELGYLYGTILTDGDPDGPDRSSANICVFADRQVDRSPCGSGVTARMAVMAARGAVGAGAERRFAGPTGAEFSGLVARDARVGANPAVVVEVGGRAHYTGTGVFRAEDDDAVEPFLLR